MTKEELMLPRYVKFNPKNNPFAPPTNYFEEYNNTIGVVDKYINQLIYFDAMSPTYSYFGESRHLSWFLPATESEYLSYMKSKNKEL